MTVKLTTEPTVVSAAVRAPGLGTASAVGRPLKTFDIDNCRDMLDKLVRALDRYHSALLRPDQSDHATNFVITAWQLADWVWALPRFAPLKVRIEAETGEPLNELWKFHRWIGENCRELEYCRVVGTISKHAEIRRDNPSVGTATSLGSLIDVPRLSASSTATAEWVDTHWTFKVVDDGRRMDIETAFERVVKFWTDLIYGNGID